MNDHRPEKWEKRVPSKGMINENVLKICVDFNSKQLMKKKILHTNCNSKQINKQENKKYK
jgi:hypothetical protein